MTSLEARLSNLVRTNTLKPEPPNQAEIDGLTESAVRKLTDAQRKENSPDTRFTCAYDAAHSLALVALRRQGFRSTNRAIVFQLLGGTANFPEAKWRFLDNCHGKRNAALYEGEFDTSSAMIEELIEVTMELLSTVRALGGVSIESRSPR
jgi:hypothetical protein